MLTLRRSFPLAPTAGVARDFQHMMEHMFNLMDTRPDLRTGGVPAVNVWEDSGSLFAEAEVPGFKMEDLEILVAGNELNIKGRRETHLESGAYVHRQERTSVSFARVIPLPVDVDADRVQATLKDGVLRIEMPKAEQARARRIAVRSE